MISMSKCTNCDNEVSYAECEDGYSPCCNEPID